MKSVYQIASRIMAGAAAVLLVAALAAGLSTQEALGGFLPAGADSNVMLTKDCTSNSCATCIVDKAGNCSNSSGSSSCQSGKECSGCKCQITPRKTCSCAKP